ncbi:UNVERIFIED_CONTAM: hypothetical protein H355_001629 [Colinus virginianus]|nr:hypothetical protein H355_001629 [Colinus virginianus]
MSSSVPADMINLRLILVSGKTKEFLFSPNDSAADIAKHVYDNWPMDWEEEQVSSPNILRLIYQGRFLHGNVTLGALKLPFGKTTVMHLVARETLPEPNSQGMLCTRNVSYSKQQFFNIFLDRSVTPTSAGSFALRSAAREKSKFVGDVDEADDGSRGGGSSLTWPGADKVLLIELFYARMMKKDEHWCAGASIAWMKLLLAWVVTPQGSQGTTTSSTRIHKASFMGKSKP